MQAKNVSLGQMWKSEESGDVYMVTSLHKDLFVSYALLRSINPSNCGGLRRAKLVKTASGETIEGFCVAEMV